MNQALMERVNLALAHVRDDHDADTATLSTRAVLFDISRNGQDEEVAKSIITRILDHDGEDMEAKLRFKLMLSVSHVTLYGEVIVEAEDEDEARLIIENDDEAARKLMAGVTWRVDDEDGSRGFGTARITEELFITCTAGIDDVEETDETPEEPTAEPVTEQVTAPEPEPEPKNWNVTFKYGTPTRYQEVTDVRAISTEQAVEFASRRIPRHIAESHPLATRAIPDDAGAIPVRFSDGSI